MIFSKVVSVQFKKNSIQIFPLRSEIFKPGFCVGLDSRRVYVNIVFSFLQMSLYVNNWVKTATAKVCRVLYFLKFFLVPPIMYKLMFTTTIYFYILIYIETVRQKPNCFFEYCLNYQSGFCVLFLQQLFVFFQRVEMFGRFFVSCAY